MLLAARDEETGEGLNDRQLRDEVMTLLLAGHETTAMALSWTFYLLSLHPGVAAHARERGRAGARRAAAPASRTLPRLRYTRMVLDEALRLYPPAWVVTRSADGDDEIGGFTIPAGSRVLVSPYVTQHDPTLWDDPEGFDPDGSRPRRRTGAPALRVLPVRRRAAPVHRRRLRDDGGDDRRSRPSRSACGWTWSPGAPVAIDPLVTLRPKPGIWVTARAR